MVSSQSLQPCGLYVSITLSPVQLGQAIVHEMWRESCCHSENQGSILQVLSIACSTTKLAVEDCVVSPRECFKVYFTHRFRATFGRAKVVQQGEKVWRPMITSSCIAASHVCIVGAGSCVWWNQFSCASTTGGRGE